ncbi:ribosylnicotinamide kinase [Podila epigama]|nr:ribosylnicotinamide kinase [Podila epigama]
MSPSSPTKVICIGLSTLIHQDDFYLPENQLPIDPKTGLANWDCPQAIDFEALIQTLTYIRAHGDFPAGFNSLEEKNPVGSKENSTPIPQATLDTLRDHIMTKIPSDRETKFVIVDGFMLFVNEHLCDTLDIKFFLSAPYSVLKERRESRKGYATLEGYWEDPPGYFDDIVWPNYLEWNGPFIELMEAIEAGQISGEYDSQKDTTRTGMTKNVDLVSSGNASIQSMVEQVSKLIARRL